ncbi:MAG: PD-(D/E)XK nuclease family protein [Megasphaera sp.]|jgi:hypothetical protein|nr:PD-(D/E)XK nuclease family protein [Megasphaera sp.]
MEKLQNNLFTYATSELSQDAFLCWLISFADSTAEKDSHLQSCARKFLCTAIPALENETINKIKINKQYKHIDALITINEKYELIIEDKTYTEEHNDQLHRYTKEIEDEFTDKGFKVKGLYYKIGFQNDYSAIQDAGYEIIDRSTMLEILNPFKEKIKNQIWQDYYEFLDDFEKRAQEFKTEAVKNWTWYQVYGFYDDLQKSNF